MEVNAAHTVRLEKAGDGGLLVRLRNIRTREEEVLNPADVAQVIRRTASPAS